MKIAILTFSKENNNGANLQCYALVETLKEMGHEVDIIDIQLPPINYGIINKIIHWPQHLNYVLFRRKHMDCFTRPFHDVKDLKVNLPQRDLYIVGSDQVWNPDITERLDPLLYFFSFLPDGARRIAYAASFGISEWNRADLKTQIEALLSKFERISVREQHGVEICANTFGVEAQVVCDPTILLSSYDKICGKYDSKRMTNELVYFKFSRNRKIESFLLEQATSKEIKMVKLGDFHPLKGCIFRPFYTIGQWLNTIRYARFVLTDSFHCMVFCILFQKSFIVMPSSVSRSSRMVNLLQQIGLTDRLCWNESELKERFESLYNGHIDYKEVNEQVQTARNQGLNFLKTYINSICG